MTPPRLPVFISWSGQPSKSVAIALDWWLRRVLQNVAPWVSTEIGSGRRWGREIDSALARPGFGVLCITPDNATAPWLNYEAGALGNGLGRDSRVCPYLIGLTPAQIPAGPLTRFQAVIADEDGTFDLIAGINEELGEQGLSEEQLRDAFEKWWPDLLERLRETPTDAPPPSPRRDREVLDEVLESTRALMRLATGEAEARERFAWQRAAFQDARMARARVLYALEALLETGATRLSSEWFADVMQPVPEDVTRGILLELARAGAWEYSAGPGDDFDETLSLTGEAPRLIREAVENLVR